MFGKIYLHFILNNGEMSKNHLLCAFLFYFLMPMFLDMNSLNRSALRCHKSCSVFYLMCLIHEFFCRLKLFGYRSFSHNWFICYFILLISWCWWYLMVLTLIKNFQVKLLNFPDFSIYFFVGFSWNRIYSILIFGKRN